jgi:hypothetical protein
VENKLITVAHPRDAVSRLVRSAEAARERHPDHGKLLLLIGQLSAAARRLQEAVEESSDAELYPLVAFAGDIRRLLGL